MAAWKPTLAHCSLTPEGSTPSIPVVETAVLPSAPRRSRARSEMPESVSVRWAAFRLPASQTAGVRCQGLPVGPFKGLNAAFGCARGERKD